MRLTCSQFYVDARLTEVDGRWLASADAPDGGSGDEFTLSGTVTYRNGETWHAVSLITVKAGKIWRETSYFAPPFEVPDWRKPFVERE
jgi:hypothetical protein